MTAFNELLDQIQVRFAAAREAASDGRDAMAVVVALEALTAGVLQVGIAIESTKTGGSA
jgi:hypothetical protein